LWNHASIYTNGCVREEGGKISRNRVKAVSIRGPLVEFASTFNAVRMGEESVGVSTSVAKTEEKGHDTEITVYEAVAAHDKALNLPCGHRSRRP